MATGEKKLQPIIIKRVKKGGHGHHGGAWKIAYADFVTAMMAFFLLMWLLGSTSEGDKKGIADYFSSPLKVAMMGGSGAGDATSLIKGGGTDLSRSTGQVARGGELDPARRRMQQQAMQAELERAEGERMRAAKARVEQVLLSNVRLAEFRSQIKVDVTPDGLRIQIVDDQSRPMFDSGRAVVKDYMRDILRDIGHVLNDVDSRISLSGHTDAAPFSGGERGYSNWELSADRANASRRELIAGGMDERKVARVVGLAASVPFDEAAPAAPVNRRISIVVLNRMAEKRVLRGAEVDASDAQDVERAVQGDAADRAGAAARPAAGARIGAIQSLPGRRAAE